MDVQLSHFLELARIQSEVNKLFDVLLETRGAGGEGTQRWLPNVDICETDCEVVVRCEVPGVGREGLRVSAQGGVLVICGEKARTQTEGETKFHCVERAYGEFRRVVHLPPTINTGRSKAILDNGVLTIHFPKVSNRRGEEVLIPILEETISAL